MVSAGIDRIRALLDDTLDSDLRAELELLVARNYVSAGELELAERLLLAAAPRLGPASHPQLAGEWLRLARAWTRGANVEDRAAHVEAALRRAAGLDPSQARAQLAQYLQRSKRLPEAAAEWEHVLAITPHDATAALNLARLYEQLGQVDRAVQVCVGLVEAAPSARNYLTIAQRLAELEEVLPAPSERDQIRIAVVGNATLDHLVSYVRVECQRIGLRATMYQAPFDQYTQEMLDPSSGLYAFRPQIVICAIHASRLFPNIHRDPFSLSIPERQTEIDAGIKALDRLLAAFTERSQALVLLHNMVVPQHPALGILDWHDEFGQAEAFATINRRLAELARNRYRTVYIVDEDRVQARAGKAAATDARQWLTTRVAWSDSVLLGLAREYMRYVRPLRSLTRKCLVLDLDNTLWGGVVGEDGIDGIQLGADAPGNAFVAFQSEIDRLWRRGVLLAVCSKNNPDDAWPVFERHASMVLRTSHIAAHRINWQSKVANLREIAAELNIGLDSLVFVDDNPVERAAVRAELPQVLVPEWPTDPAQYRAALLELDVFESLAMTAEDRDRAKLYTDQRLRREFEASTGGGSLEEYLAGLQMQVEIAAATQATLPRIAQLTNKTNQFNLTTRRYTEGELRALQGRGFDIFGMHVSDRFGDNGLVGVAILGPNVDGTREIDSLLLSCRVMGRRVEAALLDHLAVCTRADGASRMRGWFIPTSKNAPAAECYEHYGFALDELGPNGSSAWDLNVTTHTPQAPDWLTVRSPSLVG